ncbi:ComEA family DNA-binding protein [Aquisalimonas asiatica]|uniref:Helix-hairpin-helix motif-containing protein n=1 Tax=Aquisalimonas asiatica TaxID=406100 RepID=A0A1H8T147_9GAMM|nr:helix-hairpin-helix domain-containing protein [Aquisalimonas asiatica]SEO84314.1 Helix-hairpin-helix motif-containing protein [Aquisalimonas asiatica]
MGFFNLGKKDAYGRQRRIEHRGRYLRASRTGGVALRAQAKAAGVNVTANTSHGFRVSGTPARNTQVALQNGRFILRGRYRSGPFRLNLSKTGATVSTRNRLGSFNWFRPNRSSAKLAGVQVRGKTAAQLQIVYMLFAAVVAVVQLVAAAFIGAVRLVLAVGGIAYGLVLAAPYAWNTWQRRRRNRGLENGLPGTDLAFQPPIQQWRAEAHIAGWLMAYLGWGRGHAGTEIKDALRQRLSTDDATFPVLAPAIEELDATASSLEAARDGVTEDQPSPHEVVAVLARHLRRRPAEELAEVLLQADDLALQDGPRTVLQEELLEVFADFAGVRLQEVEAAPEAAPETAVPHQKSRPVSSGIDINTASLEALQTLPHLGPERARAVIALRPVQNLSALEAVDGIGPKRLEDLRTAGAYCS